MGLPQKTFQAKLYSFKGQIDGLVGMETRGRLKQNEVIDELAVMLMEIGKAIEATEEQTS